MLAVTTQNKLSSISVYADKKVPVGNDQDKGQSEYNTIQYNTIILLLNLKYIHETLTIFNRLSTERER